MPSLRTHLAPAVAMTVSFLLDTPSTRHETHAYSGSRLGRPLCFSWKFRVWLFRCPSSLNHSFGMDSAEVAVVRAVLTAVPTIWCTFVVATVRQVLPRHQAVFASGGLHGLPHLRPPVWVPRR